jgi:hypothetical protein
LIVDEPSQELLEFSKLTPDGFNTTAMSACCGTLMCGTHPLYEGKTISVNADSCRVTIPSSLPVQAVVFACDAPIHKAGEIARRSSVPVIFDVYKELDHPALQAFVKAATTPISEDALALSDTNFEELCSQKTLTIRNAFYKESRAGKPESA